MGHPTPRRSLTAVFVLCAFLTLTSSASAELSFGPPGSGAGQTGTQKRIAVDSSNGQLYVADRSNNRIDVFDSSGGFLFAFGWKVNATSPEEKLQTCTALSGCQIGTAGGGAGQLANPEQIAVDPSSHAVYVSETNNHRVQKFDSTGHFEWMVGGEVDKVSHANLCTVAANCGAGVVSGASGEEGKFLPTLEKGLPVAVGPGGNLFVADSKMLTADEKGGLNTRIQKFAPSGTYVGPQIFLPDTVFRVQALAVDASGDVYVATDGGTGAVRKYDTAGNPVSGWGEAGKVGSSSNINSLAVDSADNLFVGDLVGSDFTILTFDPTGAQTRAFYGSLKAIPSGLAPYSTATGDVFATESGGILHIPFPPPGPLLPQGSLKAVEIGNSKATLKAQLNPEGKATEIAFQYVDDATFQADQPNGFEHASTSSFSPVPLPGGASFKTQEVEQKLPVETLVPETEYHFRLVARNADAPSGNIGDEATFTTLGPPEVLESWVSDVGTDTARLHAEVNPLLLATKGHFQYVDDETYREDVEALGAGHGFDHATDSPTQVDFGNGEEPVSGVAQIFPLAPGTTYHYRMVLEGVFDPVAGPERLLHTFGLRESSKGCSNAAFRSGPSAALPDCRAYEMVSPLDKNNGDVITRLNITGYETYLDQSSPDGSKFTFSSYRAFADPEFAPYTSQYLTERGKDGWRTEALSPKQGSASRLTFELENPYKAFTEDLSQAWLLRDSDPPLDPCAPPGFADLYHRDNATDAFEALSCTQPSLASVNFVPELEGFSADGSHALVRINDELAVSGGPQPSSAGKFQVYLSTPGHGLRLVSVLPSGQASDLDSSAGTALNSDLKNHHRFQRVQGAISRDGTRVFWSTNAGGPLYLRLNADREQSESGACDEAERACTIPISGGENALFQLADPEGTKVLYSVTSGAFKDNLYRYDVSEETRELIAEGVIEAILGASEDLSRIYFASKEANASQQAEGATPGEPNLYLYEEGTTRFIGTLSSKGPTYPYSDLEGFYGKAMAAAPIFHTARVNPDGSRLVFMSNSRELAKASADYDNTDQSGRPDFEVYLYDASAEGGAGKLRCVSCSPTGASPRGRRIAEGSSNTGEEDPYAAATIPKATTQFYQPRYLSEDGNRVFFNSFEALVIGDSNGAQDVYQWQAEGSGECTSKSSSYASASEGCLSLISSGQSPEDSKFLDADPDGSDVFFTTSEGLVPQDYGLIDVYDARIGGGFAPPPPPPPACVGDACQSPPAAPNDPSPASATFKGAQNPAPRKPRKQASKRKQGQKKHKHRRKQAQRKQRNAHRNGRAAR